MPPSAKRASRARREPRKAAATSPAEIQESSPTRPAKRRKKVQEEEEPPAPDGDQLVSQIAQHLRNQPVQASKDHANAIHQANGGTESRPTPRLLPRTGPFTSPSWS
ncbi:transcription factor [Fusarium falciforme]|nr:transcription factor [Fusarium falciforme]